ncbi:hypothetical protein MNKW57_15550 [Biformimicrobium ophioploci]|uniref:Uncharacterized protein n=1 Tax=Biformimicrobium ophioploci TaxID=3036711 RepID=A0ABQ6LYR3_9GAMM|nr:hypothetical protein MNKW57_15550 [Microbulbifer sp. NKW57]
MVRLPAVVSSFTTGFAKATGASNNSAVSIPIILFMAAPFYLPLIRPILSQTAIPRYAPNDWGQSQSSDPIYLLCPH